MVLGLVDIRMNQDRLKSVLIYDECTGDFKWSKPVGRWKAGDIAGSVFDNGYNNKYRRITIDGKQHFAHRLAWLYVTGEWPSDYIDHINHDGLDNRFDNLRLASNEMNQKNIATSKRNASGIIGVCMVTKSSKWHSWVSREGRQVHLGSFDNFFEACCSRKSAELQNGYHQNYGSNL